MAYPVGVCRHPLKSGPIGLYLEGFPCKYIYILSHYQILMKTTFKTKKFSEILRVGIQGFFLTDLYSFKIRSFLWTMALGRILTSNNLRKRQVVVIDWCCMSKKDGETIDHLLLHWPLARELWNMEFSLIGVSWVMPRGIVKLWAAKFNKCKSAVIWSMIPHCLMWGIWWEMNAHTF